MDNVRSSPLATARQFWPWLAPTWLMPLGLMLLVLVCGEPSRDKEGNLNTVAIAFLVLFFGSCIPALILYLRRGIPLLAFSLAWLAPMMALWVGVGVVRAIILTLLGRSL